MKKIGLCLLVVVIAVVLAILLPWENIGELKNKLTGGAADYASLKVYSLGGDMKVFVDGAEKGTVLSDTTYLEIFPIEVGKHEVKLVRIASNDIFYEEFLETISFEKGFDTVISWELGPTEESTSGWILYARRNVSAVDDVKLNVESDPKGAQIKLDGGEASYSPLVNFALSHDKQHNLIISEEGYQTMELPILPEDEEERNLLRGYDLFLDIDLYKLPI
ncbi:MAG: PEGA domain-containing protein [Candidatus Dojkabacteria bacterium]|nr:PEGA domain-containing protein [Candidatus Dojkabacteria bacterium]